MCRDCQALCGFYLNAARFFGILAASLLCRMFSLTVRFVFQNGKADSWKPGLTRQENIRDSEKGTSDEANNLGKQESLFGDSERFFWCGFCLFVLF